MTYRTSASFGKRQEYVAVAELLRRGFDVYMTLVDDQQIDCVVRQEQNSQLRYLDVQIKARSNQCNLKDGGFFPAMHIRNPRPNFFFIFYSEHVNTYWIVPSLELVVGARSNKSGANAGKFAIQFCNATKAGLKPRPRFRKYESAFHLLNWNIATVNQEDTKS